MKFIFDKQSSDNIIIFGPTYLDLDSYCLCLDFYKSNLWCDLNEIIKDLNLDFNIFKYYLERYMLGYESFNEVFKRSYMDSHSLLYSYILDAPYITRINFYKEFKKLLSTYKKNMKIEKTKERQLNIYYRVYQLSRLKGSLYLMYYISCIEFKSKKSLRNLIKELNLPLLTPNEEDFIINFKDEDNIENCIEIMSNLLGGV